MLINTINSEKIAEIAEITIIGIQTIPTKNG